MKYISILMIGAVFIAGCGRLVKVSEKEQMVRQVFNAPLSNNEIYDRALEWCAKKFVNLNDAIVVKDREKGRIIGKGNSKYSEYFDFLVDREFSYAFTIEVKDGRYRVTFDNFIVYYDERQIRSSKAEFKFEIGKIKKILGPLMKNLHEYVVKDGTDKEKKKEEQHKEDEW
jgi:hypothetical protein